MAYTTSDLLALGLEFDNDPAGLGYPAGGVENTANDVPFSDAINLVRESLQIKKRSLATSAIAGVIDPTEHEALSDAQARWLKDCVLDVGTIDVLTATQAVEGLKLRFPTNTSSGVAIRALFTQAGNRLQQMFEQGLISEIGSFTSSIPGAIRSARLAQ